MALSLAVSWCWLVAMLASIASGAGMNLAWNDCSVGFPSMNRNFACDTNSGSSVLVVSFEPPDGITKLIGGSAVIDVISDSQAIPSWWQIGASGCRGGSLHLDLGVPSSANCLYPWSGAATGSVSYSTGTAGYAFRGRIAVTFGIPDALAGPVQTGSEYYAFRLSLDHSKSVGADACGACEESVCIILTALWLYQPAGLGDHGLCNPLMSNLVTWNGPGLGDCPGTDSAPPWWPNDCLTTRAARRSWGLIKGLYR